MKLSAISHPPRGFTALELIIVLVVGFSIIALSASKMGQLFSSSSTTAAMSSILELYTSARSLRGPAGYGADGTNIMKSLVEAKMVPKTLAISGETLKNEWNGTITIVAKGKDNDRMGFDITYPGVPTEPCVKIAQSLLGSGNFTTLTIGETENISTKTSMPEVVTACAPEDTKSVDMVFQFRE